LENIKQQNLNRKPATCRAKKELFYFYRTAMVFSFSFVQNLRVETVFLADSGLQNVKGEKQGWDSGFEFIGSALLPYTSCLITGA